MALRELLIMFSEGPPFKYGRFFVRTQLEQVGSRSNPGPRSLRMTTGSPLETRHVLCSSPQLYNPNCRDDFRASVLLSFAQMSKGQSLLQTVLLGLIKTIPIRKSRWYNCEATTDTVNTLTGN